MQDCEKETRSDRSPLENYFFCSNHNDVLTPCENNKLIKAVNDNNLTLVRDLIENKDYNIEATDEHGRTAIMASVVRGHTEIIKYLLLRKANLSKRDLYGYSITHLSIYNNSFCCVKLLSDAGADFTTLDAKGRSILYSVCMQHKEQHNYKVREFLLKRFITSFSNHELENLLGIVLENGDFKTVKLLLKYGVYSSRFANSICNLLSYSLDWTDFHSAIVINDISFVREYDLSNLFPLSEEDEIYNPLFLANIMGNLPAVKVLLEYGVEANYNLMLKYAIRSNKHDLVDFWKDFMNFDDCGSLLSCMNA